MTWHPVAQAADIQEGESKEVVVSGEVIALFRHGNDWFALDGMCAHQGGPIARGSLADGCVTCPWHGWQYHLKNGNNATTGKAMLRSYPVRVADGRVEIDLGTNSE